MRVEFTKESFEHAVGLANRASGKNVNLPVLSCVLFEAKNKVCYVRSTNLDLGVEVAVSAKVMEDGIVAVPATLLSQYAGTLGDEQKISIELKETVLVVTTKKGTTEIKTMPADDFPTLPAPDAKKAFLIPAATLLTGFRSVWYAASVSTVKPELGSIYVYHHDSKMFFVATDSFRLAEKSIALPKITSFDPVLIPYKNVGDCMRILESASGDVEVRVTPTQLGFYFDNVFVTSRLIDGTFPDYKQIIPKDPQTTVTCLKADLVQTLKKAVVFSDSFHQVGFVVDPAKKVCTIRATNADVGTIDERIDATIQGEPLTINFNYRYLLDCFQSIGTDSVSLSFSGPGRPLVVRGVGDPSFLYLAMPLNR
jgi:DNA polymerase-3 subunit beta